MTTHSNYIPINQIRTYPTQSGLSQTQPNPIKPTSLILTLLPGQALVQISDFRHCADPLLCKTAIPHRNTNKNFFLHSFQAKSKISYTNVTCCQEDNCNSANNLNPVSIQRWIQWIIITLCAIILL